MSLVITNVAKMTQENMRASEFLLMIITFMGQFTACFVKIVRLIRIVESFTFKKDFKASNLQQPINVRYILLLYLNHGFLISNHEFFMYNELFTYLKFF